MSTDGLRQSGGNWEEVVGQDYRPRTPDEQSDPLTATGNPRWVPTRATCATGETTHALTSEGHDASEDGTGRGTPIVVTSESSAPSPRSAGSISDSSEQECASESKQRSIPGGDVSSSGIGPTASSTTTYVPSLAGTLDKKQRGPNHEETFVVQTSSAAASPAKTSASRASGAASPGNAPDSSLSSPGSQMSFAHDGSSLRTSLGSSPLPTEETLPSFSARWATSGMASHGGYSTLDSSESPSVAVECSLSDVLVANPSRRYALSARAASGILRRAAARGRELPEELEKALRALSTSGDSDAGTKASKP